MKRLIPASHGFFKLIEIDDKDATVEVGLARHFTLAQAKEHHRLMRKVVA